MNFFRRKREDRAVDEELQAHLDEHIDELVESGMTEAEARRVARKQLGARTQARERIHEQNGIRLLDAVGGDLRFAWRMIRFHPWFSGAILALMAFGIGTNTAVFTLVNAVLFKPLPYKGGDRVVVVAHRNLKNGFEMPIPYPDYLEYRGNASTFEDLEAYQGSSLPLRDRAGDPQQVIDAVRVTPGFLDMLGAQPAQGRRFAASDTAPASERVLLISDALWRGRYAMAPDVVGRQVVLAGEPATIIGVMPAGFSFPGTSQIWTPLVNTPLLNQPMDRSMSLGGVRIVGVRKPGVSIDQARADLGVIMNSLLAEPAAKDQGVGLSVMTFHEEEVGGEGRILFLLLQGAVTFVLFIACANVANMMLSRSMTRQREFSVRAALGASRWRMIRQSLVESLLLSAAGGAIGLGLSAWATRAFDAAVVGQGKPSWIVFEMDYVAYAYFAGLCLLSGILFGLLPGLRASRANLNTLLKEGSRDSGSKGARFASGALVVLQFTLAVVLLAGSGLFFQELLVQRADVDRLPLGSVLTARTGFLPEDRYRDGQARYDFYERLLAETRTLPGVSEAALTSSLPMIVPFSASFQVDGEADQESARPPAGQLTVSPGYFSLLDLPIRAGRAFDDRDGLPGREVAIVSVSFAERAWPGQSPIGKRLRSIPTSPTPPKGGSGFVTFGPQATEPGPWLNVIGVSGEPPSEPGAPPVVFLPYTGQNPLPMWLMARSSADPSALTNPLRAALQRVDSDLALYDVQTLAEFVDSQNWELGLFGAIFLIFAGGALAMASIGIYAVASQAAAQRTREMGIRVALGADSGDILRLAMGRGIKQLGIGLILGLAISVAATRVTQSVLRNVSLVEPVVLGTVIAIVSMVGLAACWIPARRSTSLDPATVLREE